MSSTRAALLGVQAPRVRLEPKRHWTEGDDAAFLASGYGLTPDPWQSLVVDSWLARRKDGRLASGRCGLAVPRQNGKNGAIEIVELYKTVALARKILHTAHEVKTARKAFIRLCSFFESAHKYPELAALVKEIRKTNGQEAIVLTNGGSVEFVARSRGSGRGYTVDDLVCDEAQELTDEQLEALLPTISSAPSGDPQIIMTGTPPVDRSLGAPFVRMRDAGHEGKDARLSWHEWSVDPGANPDDRSLWAATNPALGSRLNITVVEDERGQMSDTGFMRERLGMWLGALSGAPPVIATSTWDALESTPVNDGPTAFGIRFSPDGSQASMSGARAIGSGFYVECFGSGSPVSYMDAMTEWLSERWRDCETIVIDGKGAADVLEQRLIESGVRPRKILRATTSSAPAAYAGLLDHVQSGRVSHSGQPGLRASIECSTRRDIGSLGAWGYKPNVPDGDSTPVESVALAISGLNQTKKGRPKRPAKERGKAVFA